MTCPANKPLFIHSYHDLSLSLSVPPFANGRSADGIIWFVQNRCNGNRLWTHKLSTHSWTQSTTEPGYTLQISLYKIEREGEINSMMFPDAETNRQIVKIYGGENVRSKRERKIRYRRRHQRVRSIISLTRCRWRERWTRVISNSSYKYRANNKHINIHLHTKSISHNVKISALLWKWLTFYGGCKFTPFFSSPSSSSESEKYHYLNSMSMEREMNKSDF